MVAAGLRDSETSTQAHATTVTATPQRVWETEMETLQKEPGQATAVAKAIYQKLYILHLLNGAHTSR